MHSLARRGCIALLGLALAAHAVSAAEKNDEAADKIVISGASGGLAGETLEHAAVEVGGKLRADVDRVVRGAVDGHRVVGRRAACGKRDRAGAIQL